MQPLSLEGSSLFQGVSLNRREPFVPLARSEQVQKGDYVFRLGERAERLFIVRSGAVHLTMPMEVNGRERNVVVQEAAAGDTIGWSAVIDPYRFTMNAVAATDVELVVFYTRELQSAMEACPDAGLRIMTNLARVIARRLQVMHTMWTRELQRAVTGAFG